MVRRIDELLEVQQFEKHTINNCNKNNKTINNCDNKNNKSLLILEAFNNFLKSIVCTQPKLVMELKILNSIDVTQPKLVMELIINSIDVTLHRDKNT